MRFYGIIGYGRTVETAPGVHTEQMTTRPYIGDVTRNSSMFQGSAKVNDDLNISNDISIVADPYAFENFCFMRYVEWMGAKWKINSAEIQYPRVILHVGGVYHDEE